jgi:hypothetical protein
MQECGQPATLRPGSGRVRNESLPPGAGPSSM